MTLTSSSSSALGGAARERWGIAEPTVGGQAGQLRAAAPAGRGGAGGGGGRPQGAEGAASGRSRGGAGEGARGCTAAGPSR